jgi:hypothetical protein
MEKHVATPAWLLRYLLPWAMLAFGTVTQGDDGPWMLSLFFLAPAVALGFVLLGIYWGRLHHRRWLGLLHVVSVLIAARVLPGYWQRVTLARDHIGAGFSTNYIQAFEPAWWHSVWAPMMSLLVLRGVVQRCGVDSPKNGLTRRWERTPNGAC